MNAHASLATAAAKLARRATRLRGRGGSALPGLVAETVMPGYLKHMLESLPDGVVVVTGTNGKTTTTKLIADSLTALGKQVLTNKTGSNFTRGIAAQVALEVKVGRKLPHDIAIIELDEAYARKFVHTVKPRFVVALNVIRDQLDRFGEIDTTARLLAEVMQAATGGVVVNRDDQRLRLIAAKLDVPVAYYGVSDQLKPLFPSDEELYLTGQPAAPADDNLPAADVLLTSFKDNVVSYTVAGAKLTAPLQVTGQYNYQNSAAALALLQLVLPAAEPAGLLGALAAVKPAFGRGDRLQIGDKTVEVLLVKNPAGFRQSLLSFTSKADVMIAINDNDADGHDVSWLWDVDFTALPRVAMVSGIRADDMALRLQYDDVAFDNVETNLSAALKKFLHGSGTKRIFCTYTAMLPIHAELSRLAGQERSL